MIAAKAMARNINRYSIWSAHFIKILLQTLRTQLRFILNIKMIILFWSISIKIKKQFFGLFKILRIIALQALLRLKYVSSNSSSDLFVFRYFFKSQIIIFLQDFLKQEYCFYKSNYNVCFVMQKFRFHKHRIINSKRDSQKIDQLDLITLNAQDHPTNISFNFAEMMNKKLYTITEENYKIKGFVDVPEAKSMRTLAQSKIAPNMQDQVSRTIVTKKNLSQNDTFKTQNQSSSPASEQCLLQNILSLMKNINNLQQKCVSNCKTSEPIQKEIKTKLSEFKTLMGQFQNSFQTSMLDFYNEENQVQGSPTSFNSRSSQQAQPENTDRQAYQMQQKQNLKKSNEEEEQQPQIQLKYRRITDSTQSFDTFSEDAQKDYYSPQKQHFLNIQQEKQEKSLNESSIIHLFSYQKQKCLQSPLPSITQRSSEYCSPESKYPGNQLFSESLEYKKIFYLLQTTQKKKDIANSTSRHEVSEFQLSNTNAQVSRKSSFHQHIDRNKSHSQLKDMINLLQTKYKRSIRKDVDTSNTSLDAVLNSKSIRQRGKR